MSVARNLRLLMILAGVPVFSQIYNYNSISLSDEELKQYRVISNELWLQMGKPAAPPYPSMSKLAKATGPVEVFLQIDNSGKVLAADTCKSSSYHPSLGPTAMAWCRQLKFPSTNSDEPSTRKFKIYVVFSMPGKVEIQPTPDMHFN